MMTPVTHSPYVDQEHLYLLRKFAFAKLRKAYGGVFVDGADTDTNVMGRPVRVWYYEQRYSIQTRDWALVIDTGPKVAWFDGDFEAFERDFTLIKMVAQ